MDLVIPSSTLSASQMSVNSSFLFLVAVISLLSIVISSASWTVLVTLLSASMAARRFFSINKRLAELHSAVVLSFRRVRRVRRTVSRVDWQWPSMIETSLCVRLASAWDATTARFTVPFSCQVRQHIDVTRRHRSTRRIVTQSTADRVVFSPSVRSPGFGLPSCSSSASRRHATSAVLDVLWLRSSTTR